MKVSRVKELLDLAEVARSNNMQFNPCLRGDAGLAKSDSIKQWMEAKRKIDKDYGFLDLRIAYLESPDLIGTPREDQDKDGRWRTITCLPGYWPTSGSGLLLLEEFNRGTTGVMNCLMQLLTDRKIHDYELPPGWIIAAAINPETSKYDVNNVDTALMDRFEVFDIEYDHNDFIEYIVENKWHQRVATYLKSGMWVYKSPESVAKDGKYISPRTWSKMNAAEKAGASDHQSKRAMHRIICQSILGKHIGNEYWKTCWDDAPVMANDLIKDYDKALKKIEKQGKAGDEYAGDKLSMTVESLIDAYGGWYSGMTDEKSKKELTREQWIKDNPDKIDEATMVAVAKLIPSDMAVNLIKGCGYKVNRDNPTEWFKNFNTRNPECMKIMSSNIKLNRAVK
jgi:hypothetical protein